MEDEPPGRMGRRQRKLVGPPPDLAAVALPPPPDAPLVGEVDEDVSFLYRHTSAARALADALAELSVQEGVPMDVLGATMDAFDKAMQRGMDYARHLACRAKAEGDLEVYNNVEERWRFVVRGVTIDTEASTPQEPDRTLVLGKGAALSVTCVDNDHTVQGASFRRKGGAAGQQHKRPAPGGGGGLG